jgi:hypothetical protein
MLINLEIKNDEDIKYLKKYNNNDSVDDLLRTAITIGLKSISLSEVKMNCNSYLEPIEKLINETNKNDKIDMIDEKLDNLLFMKTNSSRKGRLSENLCIRRLIENYPTWEFIDVTQNGHEGDCRAKMTPIGDILYEFKSYDTNVNKEQIKKFYYDLDTTGIKYGIFVSNTSGIVGKKNLEWEIYNKDKIIIYISNTGMNGHGCVLATELLLSIINNNNKLIIGNENEIYDDLLENIENYKLNNESIHRLYSHMKEFKSKNDLLISNLQNEIYELLLNSENTYKRMIKITKNLNNEIIEENFNLDKFISNNNFNDKIKENFNQLYKIISLNDNLNIKIHNNELLIYKNDELISKTRTLKTKLYIYIIKYSEDFKDFNITYEEFNNKQIIIEITNNISLDIINNRLSY